MHLPIFRLRAALCPIKVTRKKGAPKSPRKFSRPNWRGNVRMIDARRLTRRLAPRSLIERHVRSHTCQEFGLMTATMEQTAKEKVAAIVSEILARRSVKQQVTADDD